MGIEMVQWEHRNGTIKHYDRAVVHCNQKSNCDRKLSIVEGLWGHCDRIVNIVMELWVCDGRIEHRNVSRAH